MVGVAPMKKFGEELSGLLDHLLSLQAQVVS